MARRKKTADIDWNSVTQDLEDAGMTVHQIGGDEEPSAINSAARAETIREVCETVAELDRQIAGIKAERKAVIETRIVADLGMNKSHFAAVYKLAQFDQSYRDGLFDAMRECFAVLNIGDQLNWLDASDREEPALAAEG